MSLRLADWLTVLAHRWFIHEADRDWRAWGGGAWRPR